MARQDETGDEVPDAHPCSTGAALAVPLPGRVIAMVGNDASAAARAWQIYELLARRDGDPHPFARVEAACRASLHLLPIAGAGVMLMDADRHLGTLYATDATIQELEDLQNEAGEGPCLAAHVGGQPVLEADLAGGGLDRWPELSRAALDAGMAAIFAFPLEVDRVSVGALDLYAREPEPLSDAQALDGRLLASIIGREVLVLQATAAPGQLPDELPDLSSDRVVIEQATGMVAVQLDTDVDDAGGRLRAAARDTGRSLSALAQDVVARRERLD